MFWLFPGIPVTFRVFTTRSVYSKEPLAVLQTNHVPVPIIYLNLKIIIMFVTIKSKDGYNVDVTRLFLKRMKNEISTEEYVSHLNTITSTNKNV